MVGCWFCAVENGMVGGGPFKLVLFDSFWLPLFTLFSYCVMFIFSNFCNKLIVELWSSAVSIDPVEFIGVEFITGEPNGDSLFSS